MNSRIFLPLVCVLLLSPSVAAQESTPLPVASPEPSRTQLIDVTFAEAPIAPAFLGIARLIFTPGGMLLGGQITGPRILLVENGSITVGLTDETALLYRAESREPESVADEITITEGDRLVFPLTPPAYIGATDGTSTILDIVVWPSLPEPVTSVTTESGVVFQPLVTGEALVMPAAPMRLLLETRFLPPDGVAHLFAEAGPRLLLVTSGKLALGHTAGVVGYAPSAGNNPGSSSGPLRTLSDGKQALLTAGGNAFLQTASTVRMRNIGRNNLEFLTLHIAPAD